MNLLRSGPFTCDGAIFEYSIYCGLRVDWCFCQRDISVGKFGDFINSREIVLCEQSKDKMIASRIGCELSNTL